MRKMNQAARAVAASGEPQRLPRLSYEQLAGGLASEMAKCVRLREPGEFRAPFELVIVDPQGAVVFEGQVGEDWRVRHKGPRQIVRQSHFPATALMTDRSLLTRTFQIERASC